MDIEPRALIGKQIKKYYSSRTKISKKTPPKIMDDKNGKISEGNDRKFKFQFSMRFL